MINALYFILVGILIGVVLTSVAWVYIESRNDEFRREIQRREQERLRFPQPQRKIYFQ